MGTLLGPLVGGFLCQPAEKYNLKGPSELFVRYPYLLPCAIGAFYNVSVAVLCIPFLGETNLDTSKPSGECTEPLADEETPLVAPQTDTSTAKAASNGTRSLVMLIIGHALVHFPQLWRPTTLTSMSEPLPCTASHSTRCTLP